jgi:Family of unknown function (DUF5939)
VLDAGTTLKTVNHDEYGCTLCAAGYKPTLDEMVEVTFTVSPRARRIAGHDPDTLPEVEYYRQIFWSSGMDLPDDLAAKLAEFTIDSIEVGGVFAAATPTRRWSPSIRRNPENLRSRRTMWWGWEDSNF